MDRTQVQHVTQETPAVAARVRRHAVNIFALTLLAASAQDALPGSSDARQAVRSLCAPLLYPLGLFQGDWKLFAPEPDHVNAWIEAEVDFTDGSRATWSSPDWRQLSLRDELLRGRHAKWWDALRRDEYRALWPNLARHAAREVSRSRAPGVRARQVTLIRHWWDVPPPEIAAATGGHPIPLRAQFPHAFVYHVEVLP